MEKEEVIIALVELFEFVGWQLHCYNNYLTGVK